MQAYVVGYGSLIDGEMVFEGVSSIAFDEDKANELAEGVSDVWGGSGTFGCVIGPVYVFGFATKVGEEWRDMYMELQDSAIELEDELAETKEELRVALDDAAMLRRDLVRKGYGRDNW